MKEERYFIISKDDLSSYCLEDGMTKAEAETELQDLARQDGEILDYLVVIKGVKIRHSKRTKISLA